MSSRRGLRTQASVANAVQEDDDDDESMACRRYIETKRLASEHTQGIYDLR